MHSQNLIMRKIRKTHNSNQFSKLRSIPQKQNKNQKKELLYNFRNYSGHKSQGNSLELFQAEGNQTHNINT